MVGDHMTSEQKKSLALTILNYLEAIDGRGQTQSVRPKALEPNDFLEIKNPSFFRFVDEQTLAYLKKGSFRFGTPHYYRDIEDDGRSDRLEGYAMVTLEGKKKAFSIAATAGFNCAVLCGTSALPSNYRRLQRMRQKFGKYIMQIVDPVAFCSMMGEKLGAIQCCTRDILYADAKYMTVVTNDLDDFLAEIGKGDLTDERLHKLNIRYWASLYQHLLFPSAFSKPMRFSSERERRILFELPSNVEVPFVTIEAPEVLKFIRFV